VEAPSTVRGKLSNRRCGWSIRPRPAIPIDITPPAVFVAQAIGNDGGGLGTEKGAIFTVNVVATLAASSTHMAQIGGGELDISCASGSSVLDKYGWIIGSTFYRRRAGLTQRWRRKLFVQPGRRFGGGTPSGRQRGLNASPLTTAARSWRSRDRDLHQRIDLSRAGTISGSAFKSPGFSVTGAGLLATGANGGTGVH